MNASPPIEQQIVACIRQIVRSVDVHSRHLVTAFGLTGPQLATLQELARQGPTSVTALARGVHLSAGTVSGIIHRLERRGLVIRSRTATDRRTVLIALTDDGNRLVRADPSLLQDRFRVELARLEGWERLQILATLQRIAGLMGAERIGREPCFVSDAASPGHDVDPAIDMATRAMRFGGPADECPPTTAPPTAPTRMEPS